MSRRDCYVCEHLQVCKHTTWRGTSLPPREDGHESAVSDVQFYETCASLWAENCGEFLPEIEREDEE